MKHLPLLALSTCLFAGAVQAQAPFPNRPIKIVVGSEAGSAPDVLARIVANEMGPLLSQSIIVENKPGAAGTLGAQSVVSSPADGYTLLMGTVSNVALAPLFYPIRYEASKSFTPIGMVASVPLVLVSTPGFGANNFAEFAAKVKAAPTGSLNYSSPGVGGPQHLAGVLLQKPMGTQLTHVPYKSGSAAMTAVAGGEIQFAFAGIPAATALAQGKKVVPLMVTSSRRSNAMPEIPSATEVGVANFNIDNWHALLAPAQLPAPIRATLESALQKALTAPALQAQFAKSGAEAAPSTSEQLKQTIADESKRWATFVKENNIKAE